MSQLLAAFNFDLKLIMSFIFNLSLHNVILINIYHLKRALGHSLLKKTKFVSID